MKKLITLLLMVFCTGHAHADEILDLLEIRFMKSAKSEDELNKKISEIENIRTLKLACDMQIAANKLPYSCYDARKEMKNLKLSTSNWLAKDLDQTCVRIAHSTSERVLRKKQALPNGCLSAARAQIEINQYKTGKVFD